MPEENRLSLKWIDGNDVVTLSGGTYTEPVDVHINGNTEGIPTFNVDNPTMWTPLSVMSGLASGFCERRAVLDSEFKTGASTSKTWLQNADTPAAIADRAAIVSNCMHNLALGSDYAHLFYSSGANATMVPIGSAAVSNYMTAMDSAITAVVSGTNVYVDENGSSYESTGRAAFNGLASSAYMTASAQAEAGSAILRPSSGGGSSLKTTMAIGLPVEWAKERKWMLDELKWTEGGNAADQVLVGLGYNTGIRLESGYSNGTTGQSLYSGAISAGNVEQNDYYRLGSYTCTSKQTHINSNYFVAYEDMAGVFYDEEAPVSSGTANVYFGKSIDAALFLDYSSDYKFVSNATVAEAGSMYCIIGGGTLTIPENIGVSDVYIESGGILQMSGGSVGVVNVMDGGKYLPNVVTVGGKQYVNSFDYTSRVYQNYTNPTSPGYATLYPDNRFTNMEYITDAVNTSKTVRNVFVTGTTATGSASLSGTMTGNRQDIYCIAASRGKLSVSGTLPNLHAIVSSGGSLEIGSGTNLTLLNIAAGGQATMFAGVQSYANYIGMHVFSGGSLTISGKPEISMQLYFYLEDGAYLSIDSAAGLYKYTVEHTNIVNNTTSTFTFYTFKTPSDLIGSMTSIGVADGYTYLGSATLYQFNNFGLAYTTLDENQQQQQNKLKEGWNAIPCSAVSDMVRLAGVTDSATGMNIAASASILPKEPSAAGAGGKLYFSSGFISATTTSDGTTCTSNMSTGVKSSESFAGMWQHDGAILLNTINFMAANKLRGAANHYSEFYVRQFPTQAEIDQATSSVITT